MLLPYHLFLLIPGTLAKLAYRGVDWSSLTVETKSGATFSTSKGVTEPLEKILVASGVNIVRQRVMVNPSNGEYNLAYNLALAKRAKAAGLKVYLAFMYGDGWNDPQTQSGSIGWPDNADGLADKLYHYTMETLNAFATADIPVEIVALGNEITAGMLWPFGSIPNYYNIARFLHSASAGVKDSKLAVQPKIMIHTDNAWNSDRTINWYTKVLAAGPLKNTDFDIMGVSYYPFYSEKSRMANLKTALTRLDAKFSKPILVAETGYPTSCPNPEHPWPTDLVSIPFSAAGQTTWIKDIANILTGINGLGVVYWEPAWLSNPNLGSSCANVLMFDSKGKALDSLSVFATI